MEVDGSQTADVNCKEASFVISKLPEDDASVKSPVVNGNQVTFYYEDTSQEGVDAVYLRGTMCGWGDDEKVAFTKRDGNVFSHTIIMSPGVYYYKLYKNPKF